MGFAKRMWEEEQARGYHSSSDAVCANCFDDPGLCAFIEQRLEIDTCSICGEKSDNDIAAPADEVLQFFLDKVYRYYEDANGSAPYDGREGGYQIQTYSMSDLIFDEYPDIAPYDTLEWLNSKLKDDVILCDRDWQILTPGQALEVGWGSFANSVKHTTRFLFFPKTKEAYDEDFSEPYSVRPEEMLEQLGQAIKSCDLIRTIPAGTKVFRARGHVDGVSYNAPKDLGPPPNKFAKTAGRMNAPGIVVFYGAYEKETAIAEATGEHSLFSIGEFETLVDLSVVDLTNLPSVPSIFMDGPRESLRFLHRFTREVSQPFEPDAEIHIEYTPTQVVSEFFRHRLQDGKGDLIRGVVYGSAKRKGTANVSLFISSTEVEGVPCEMWQKKDPVLRLLSNEESVAPK